MNGSSTSGFLLVGLSEDLNIQVVLFVLFLVIYLCTLCGNITLIIASVSDPHLHTPMYFFLVNLSFIDVCYSSAIIPNMLLQLIVRKRISFFACAAQMYTFLLLACTECLLLAVMAYDRFVSISFALRYNVIMTRSVCITMMACCWFCGNSLAVLDAAFILKLPFCDQYVVDHFFCETKALLKLACGDTFITDIVIFSSGILVLLFPTCVILFSYTCIAIAIIGIHSPEGQFKAFCTCASHLIVVTLAIGPAIFMYMKPVSKNSENQEKPLSVLYTVMPSAINPFIYSLRNKDVKRALQKVSRTHRFQ